MKTFLKILDDDTYQRVDVAYISGLLTDDYRLKDVMFEVRIVNDEFIIKVISDHEAYYLSLNVGYYHPMLVDACSHPLATFFSSPDRRRDDVMVWDDELSVEDQPYCYFDVPPVIQ